MKNYSVQALLLTASMLASTVQAQTTINPDVQSFTNADLNPTPHVPTKPAIPGMTTGPNTNQNAPFKYPALTPDQLQQIQAQMNGYVQNAEQRVQNLINKVKDLNKMPMSIDKVELESAITDLDVKKTLVSKFTGSPSLKSPKVREILMQILSKDFIQESDLAALQAIVNEERPYTYP